ncbi:MAG: glycosyltransferase family 2 protein [Fimbriimonadaceae bacterium]|jgi:glycosyltransferase involved in cell wall biosynthesis|nr:glycosyltransferase family 2 protein [Fimbriimonadaceae bacterium]
MADFSAPDLTIIVPALNEEDTIAEVIERLLALPGSNEIVVVNDGSTDQTSQVLGTFKDRVKVLTNPQRTGKGAAIRLGLTVATGKVVVIQDADLEYVPEELPAVVAPILAGQTGVSYGSRFTKGLHRGMALPNKVVNLMLRWAVALLFFRRLTDEATCYKAVRRDLLLRMNLECQRFEFCPEVTAKAIRLGQEIVEVPISYTPRTKKAGKKIRWQDAPEAFWTLLKHRIKPF